MNAPNPPHEARIPLELPTVQRLLAEWAKSLAGAPVQLLSAGILPFGARAVVEFGAKALLAPIEVLAEVVGEAQPSGQSFLLPARYLGVAPEARAFETCLSRAFESHQQELSRRSPRIPTNLVAVDPLREDSGYFVRDLSAGGLGIIVPGSAGSPAARGDRLLLKVEIEPFISLELEASVVWALDGSAACPEARFGASFPEVSEGQRVLIENLVRRRRPLRVEVTLTR